MQEDVSIERLVQKRKRARGFCVKAAFRKPVSDPFKHGTKPQQPPLVALQHREERFSQRLQPAFREL